jgi:hypothetical protein
MLNRAYENNSLIELVVLLANQIDAILRSCLILKKQLDENSEEIDVSLIHQKELDKPIMEKKIYEMALNQNIINQDTYDNLEFIHK